MLPRGSPSAARAVRELIRDREPCVASAQTLRPDSVGASRSGGEPWHVARFSYSIKPVDRERALALLGQEVEAARGQGLEARLLVPLTRPSGGPALQYELVLPNLDTFEAFREEGGWGGRHPRLVA